MTSGSIHPTYPGLTAGPVAQTAAGSLWQVRTVRYWLRAIAWTLAAIGVCLLLYTVDKWYPFDGGSRATDFRMFKNPTTVPMRIMGIPHFVIAILFLVSSRRLRENRNRLIFVALCAVSVVLCLLWQRAGAQHNAFAVFLFYFYFLFHGFRDDAFFYKTYGDMPQAAAVADGRVMVVLQLLLLGLLASLFWPAVTQIAQKRYAIVDPILANFFPADWPFVARLLSMFLPMAAVAAFALHRIARGQPEGWAGFWRVHRPILTVYLLSLGVVLLALTGGSGAFDIWVLTHFVAWFFFALFLIDRFPPKSPPEGWWGWMRTTRPGFITLHMGMAAVVAVCMAISVYGFGQSATALDIIVGKDSFYYWTIVHVTLSFVPR
jgi:hypothetical protein